MIERAKGWLRWFWEKAVLAIFNKVIVVAVGGIVATLFAFNWEDLDALWRYYLQPGNISGVYSLDGHTYKAAPPYDKIDLKWRFVLKHGGTRVFGTIGPVGKVVQRARVGGVKVQRRDGNGAGENRSVICVRLYVFVDALLEEPEIAAAARIFAFAQLIARDFPRLPREFHFALPRLGHIHVEEHLVGQAVLQNDFGRSARHSR